MTAPRIALIHATGLSVDPIDQAFKRLWPQPQRMHLLDDSLSADRARDGRLTDAMVRRFETLALYARDCGCHGVLFTCSAFGPAIEAAGRACGLPTLKPNEAMFADAIQAGGRVALVATFAPSVESMREEFLRFYETDIAAETTLFEGVADLLDTLEARRLAWGIVTNKIERFTLPLVRMIGLSPRTPCVVSGDTTPHAKPHPAPLLEAAARLGIEPRACLYVGDDERDIVAARAAGMGSIAVRYGYLGVASPPEAWGADAIIDTPLGLLNFLPPAPPV